VEHTVEHRRHIEDKEHGDCQGTERSMWLSLSERRTREREIERERERRETETERTQNIV
jgi:hypothetical protein